MMNNQIIVYCVVALLLGMLLANMLKSVCGCKLVEGYGASCNIRKSIECTPGELYDPVACNDQINSYDHIQRRRLHTACGATASLGGPACNRAPKGAGSHNFKKLNLPSNTSVCEWQPGTDRTGDAARRPALLTPEALAEDILGGHCSGCTGSVNQCLDATSGSCGMLGGTWITT
jgi:hypothetical protein